MSSKPEPSPLKAEEEEGDQEAVLLPPPPPQNKPQTDSFLLTTQAEFSQSLELRIKVNLSESNNAILERAQSAILQTPELASRLVLREANRVIIELGVNPLILDVTLSTDLDRILLAKLPENMKSAPVLFQVLKDAFAQASAHYETPPPQHNNVEEEEEEEKSSNSMIMEAVDGPLVSSKLDANYVLEVRRAMQKRMETELNAFATPLERKAQDDERRVLLLQNLLLAKYRACGLALPRLELAPSLAAFPLNLPAGGDEEGMLRFNTETPTASEVDCEFKRVLQEHMSSLSQARQERKRQEVLARGEICERNRNVLVSTLTSSTVAVAHDRETADRLGIANQVILFELVCMYQKKPAFLLILPHCLVVEFRVWGFTFGECIKLPASSCRSVHKVPPTLSVVESLCVRMDEGVEHYFYLPSILEDSTQQMDQVFELIWQVLRMNRSV